MDNKKLKIKFRLNQKEYSMTVHSEEEEEIFRAAADKVNKLIVKVRTKYEGIEEMSKEEALTLATFQSVLHEIRAIRRDSTKPFIEKFKEWENDIDLLTDTNRDIKEQLNSNKGH